MDDGLSTIRDLPDQRPGALARWTNHAGVAGLCTIVGAAALGFLGPTTDSGRAEGGGWTLEVTWPKVTRAGMPAPLHLDVSRPGGFDGPLMVTLCAPFFEDLDFQSWYPTPSADTSSADRLVYEFDPPPGEHLRISLDARTSPGQFGEIAHCSVTIREEEVDVVELDFTTVRMP